MAALPANTVCRIQSRRVEKEKSVMMGKWILAAEVHLFGRMGKTPSEAEGHSEEEGI